MTHHSSFNQPDIYQFLKEQYPETFHGGVFESVDEFRREYIGENNTTPIFATSVWSLFDYDYTIVEMCDNNHWNEIVAVCGQHTIHDIAVYDVL